MKKLFIIVSAVAIFVGCNNEKITTVGGPREFTIVSSGLEVDTKTYIPNPNPVETPTADAGKVVYWKQGDLVAIYDTDVHEFRCWNDGGVSSIRGEVSEGFSGTYYGLYPYSKYKGFERGIFNSEIPTNQYVADGEHWDPSAPIVVGSCAYDDETITFYNANSLLELYLPAHASYITVKIYGTNPIIAGDINVNVPDLTVTPTGFTYEIVTLTGNLEANTPYFIAITPTIAQSGFSLFVKYDEDFTIDGETYTKGERTYKNKKLGTEFKRDRISVLDLTKIPPISLTGGPLDPKPHLGVGSYIFRSQDGSVNLVVNQNGADKPVWMAFKVYYDYPNDNPDRGNVLISSSEMDGYQLNQTGWPDHRYIGELGPCFYVQLRGTGDLNNLYLKYDPVLQAFRLIPFNEANPTGYSEEPTKFYIYDAGDYVATK